MTREVTSGKIFLNSRHTVYFWHLHNEMCKAFSVIHHTEVCRLIWNVFFLWGFFLLLNPVTLHKGAWEYIFWHSWASDTEAEWTVRKINCWSKVLPQKHLLNNKIERNCGVMGVTSYTSNCQIFHLVALSPFDFRRHAVGVLPGGWILGWMWPKRDQTGITEM